ncbi:hypothetical protein CVS40_3144 [Lucilia cuprina]|nr:hypothetical protein CVS40_3144 [Lucilia cuprina]
MNQQIVPKNSLSKAAPIIFQSPSSSHPDYCHHCHRWNRNPFSKSEASYTSSKFFTWHFISSSSLLSSLDDLSSSAAVPVAFKTETSVEREKNLRALSSSFLSRLRFFKSCLREEPEETVMLLLSKSTRFALNKKWSRKDDPLGNEGLTSQILLN